MASLTQTFVYKMPKNSGNNNDDNRRNSTADTDSDMDFRTLPPPDLYNYRYVDAEELAETLSKRSDGFLFLASGELVRKLPLGFSLFTHSKKAAFFSAKFTRLKELMARKALLQFVHDYFTRLQMFTRFVNDLEQLAVDESAVLSDIEKMSSRGFAQGTKLEYLSAICENIRLHQNHWNSLRHKLVMNRRLHALLQRSFANKFSKLDVRFMQLHHRALTWTAHLISAGLRVFPKCDPRHFTDDILWDITRGLEDYKVLCTQAFSEEGGHHATLSRNKLSVLKDACSASFKCGAPTVSFEQIPFEQLLCFLAKERSKYMASHVYELLSQNFNLRACSPLVNVSCHALYANVADARKHSRATNHSLSSDSDQADASVGDKSLFHLFLSHRAMASSSELFSTVAKEMQCLADEALKEEEFASSFLRVVYSSTSLLTTPSRDAGSIDFTLNSSRPASARPISQRSGRGQRVVDSAKAELDSTGSEKRKSVSWSSDSSKQVIGEQVEVYVQALWHYFSASLMDLLLRPVWFTRSHGTTQLGSLLLCPAPVRLAVALSLAQACQAGTHSKLSGTYISCAMLKLVSWTAVSSWDEAFCAALGSSTVDKCHPWSPPSGDKEDSCTRTAWLLRRALLPLTFFLHLADTASAAHDAQRQVVPLVSEVVWRLEATVLQAHRWCDDKTAAFLAKWTLAPLLLVTHRDLKWLNLDMVETVSVLRHLVTMLEPPDGASDAQYSDLDTDCQQLASQASRLQAINSQVNKKFQKQCYRVAMELFMEALPINKLWTRKVSAAEMSSVHHQDYVDIAIKTLLEPAVASVDKMEASVQMSVLLMVVTATCDAWTSAILQRKIKFSIAGARQLDSDFGRVLSWLAGGVPGGEVRQSVLSLDVFRYMRAIVEVLLQQPHDGIGCMTSDKQRLANGLQESGSGGDLNRIPSSRLSSRQRRMTGAVSSLDSNDSIMTAYLPSTSDADTPGDGYKMPHLDEWLSRRQQGAGTSLGKLRSCFP